MQSVQDRVRALGRLEEREAFILWRRRHGITQGEAARSAGIIQPMVSGWEKGSYELPREKVDALWAAVDALAAGAA